MSQLVTVEGEYVWKDGTASVIEFFKEYFVVSDEMTKDKARSLIRKVLAPQMLREKVSNFRRVRTCQVLDMKPTEEKAENTDMEKAFMRAIELSCVPENIESYRRPDFKLKALEKAIAKAEERQMKLAKKGTGADVQDLGYID